ncbi:MAG: glycosyltransferase family 2 protein [Pseudomonadota bacterium]|uniref:glycosyltransferase family 2 protein n=1 Tax=Roseovarius salincola TaxID=2978479 RepID=UPI0022A83911|nr:glycosyltransferase family 2 protein [Roseovarius sp. EGI FJ00037]MCZ0814355.1 glycosyltransferase family 2 protein [Roseovarius sp. EGI FJ00037]
MLFEDFSGLRLFGVIVGLALVFASIWWGRRRSPGSSSPLPLLLMGALLFIVGLFPTIARAPADLLFIGDVDGGALIFLLVLSTIVSWLLLLWMRSRIEHVRQRSNALLHSVAVNGFMQANENAAEGDRKVFVVIPALNEEDTLPAVLADIPSEVCGHPVNIMVVDDGSTDKTGQLSKEAGAFVLRMPINSGQGSALKAGYKACTSLGAEVVATLDADGQNVARELESVVKPVLDHEADVVIGSRLLGDFEKTNISRTVGVHFFNFILSTITGAKITDCASSFRAFSAEMIDKVRLEQEQYQSAEVLVEAAKNNFRIAEVPISWRRRQSGDTRKAATAKYGFFFARTILKTWLR